MLQKQPTSQSDEMFIRDFEPQDLYYVNLWLAQREKPPLLLTDLPAFGWVCSGKLPLGAIFLRQMEGNLGLVDQLINDPSQSSGMRHCINNKLFEQMITAAKSLGMRAILGTTADSGTLERGKRHGFVPTGETLCIFTFAKGV